MTKNCWKRNHNTLTQSIGMERETWWRVWFRLSSLERKTCTLRHSLKMTHKCGLLLMYHTPQWHDLWGCYHVLLCSWLHRGQCLKPCPWWCVWRERLGVTQYPTRLATKSTLIVSETRLVYFVTHVHMTCGLGFPSPLQSAADSHH